MLPAKLKTVTALSLWVVALPALAPVAAAEKTGKVTLLRVPDKGIQPQVAVDAKGVVHLIYFRGEPGHGDVFYVRSDDDARFSEPLRVNSQPGSVIAAGSIRGAH